MKTAIKLFITLAVFTGTAFAKAKSVDEAWKSFEGTEALPVLELHDSKPVQWVISPVGVERRMEASTNPVLEPREPVNVALGLRLYRHLFSVEYSRFGESSGNETYHVERGFQDLLGWYRYSYYKNHGFHATIGSGFGIYQEQVTTSFYGLKQDLGSGNKWTAATGMGAEYEVFKYIVLFVEARLISGQNLDPNPNPDALARLSVQF